jgi:hypothetical protein
MHHMTVTVMDMLPVLLNTIEADFSMADDWPWAEQEMRRILDTHPEPLFTIDDIRELNVSLGDTLAFASLGSRGQDAIWRHPRLRGMYFISNSKLIEMAAAGLNSPTFGNTAAKAFGTVEEALADIERVLAGA